MASPTQWACVWVNSGSWWQTRRPGMLQFMGSQRVGHDGVTEPNWTELNDNPIGKTEKETQMYRTDFWVLLLRSLKTVANVLEATNKVKLLWCLKTSLLSVHQPSFWEPLYALLNNGHSHPVVTRSSLVPLPLKLSNEERWVTRFPIFENDSQRVAFGSLSTCHKMWQYGGSFVLEGNGRPCAFWWYDWMVTNPFISAVIYHSLMVPRKVFLYP